MLANIPEEASKSCFVKAQASIFDDCLSPMLLLYVVFFNVRYVVLFYHNLLSCS